MDKEYIFTRAEFAKMLDVSPNTIRMRMRRGHFAEESKYIKNKWMFKRPRPNQVVRPSRLSPVSLYRRRGITKHGTTNYDNIRNPVTARKFKEHNEPEKILEEKQKKAFSDPFMLSEKAAYKKRHDEWLIEQDRIESGYYNRKEIKTDYY